MPASAKAHWVECKASNKESIALSDYDGQIGGEIDALAEYQPWACQRQIAAISYVTTIDMIPSPKLVTTANSKGIWILNAYAYFKIDNGVMSLTFSPPYPFGTQFGQVGNIPDIPAIMRLITAGSTYVELR